jgi:hypothetical protein
MSHLRRFFKLLLLKFFRLFDLSFLRWWCLYRRPPKRRTVSPTTPLPGASASSLDLRHAIAVHHRLTGTPQLCSLYRTLDSYSAASALKCKLYRSAYSALLARTANVDTLIILSTTVAYVYSTVSVIAAMAGAAISGVCNSGFSLKIDVCLMCVFSQASRSSRHLLCC